MNNIAGCAWKMEVYWKGLAVEIPVILYRYRLYLCHHNIIIVMDIFEPRSIANDAVGVGGADNRTAAEQYSAPCGVSAQGRGGQSKAK